MRSCSHSSTTKTLRANQIVSPVSHPPRGVVERVEQVRNRVSRDPELQVTKVLGTPIGRNEFVLTRLFQMILRFHQSDFIHSHSAASTDGGFRIFRRLCQFFWRCPSHLNKKQLCSPQHGRFGTPKRLMDKTASTQGQFWADCLAMDGRHPEITSVMALRLGTRRTTLESPGYGGVSEGERPGSFVEETQPTPPSQDEDDLHQPTVAAKSTTLATTEHRAGVWGKEGSNWKGQCVPGSRWQSHHQRQGPRFGHW